MLRTFLNSSEGYLGIIVTTVRTADSDHEGHAASAKSMNLDDNPYTNGQRL